MSILTPLPAFPTGIALPAPVWLIKTLLIAGFYLHALPMNVALIGGIVAAVFLLIGQKKHHVHAERLGNTLAYSLPFFLSVAITQGIVPLLFLQLLYGPLFYSSSILMAVPWILVILLLLLGYSGYYLFTYYRGTLKNKAPWVLIGVTFLFLWIAFFFSNNTTLMLTPERWLHLYESSPEGINLNLEESQLFPRYLHFIVGALAVTGLTIGCFGWYWRSRDEAYSVWLVRTGASLFFWPTLLQVPIGIWFLLSIPHSFMMNFLGQETTGTYAFMAAMLLDIIGLIMMGGAIITGRLRFFQTGFASALMVIFLMVFMRHQLREYYTHPFFQPENQPAEPQWLMIFIFAATALLLIGYMTWLLKLLWKAFHPKSGDFSDPKT